MIHIDEVQNYFDTNFNDSNMTVETDADASNFRAKISKGNSTVEIKFSFKTQVFIFDTLRGKSTTLTSMDSIKANVETYFYLESDFKPKAQAVGDVFKSTFYKDKQVSLKGNRGSMSAGFTLIYSVKDTNQEVHVRLENKEKDIFSVSVIDDSSVLLTYNYILDEVGNISLLPTLDYFSTKILEDYKDNSCVTVTKIGANKYKFSFKDSLDISVEVIQNEAYELKYIVTQVQYNGVDLQNAHLGIIDIPDVFNLTDVYSNYDYLLSEDDIEETTDEAPVERVTEEEYIEEIKPIDDKVAETTVEKNQTEEVETNQSEEVNKTDEIDKVEEIEAIKPEEENKADMEDDFNIVLITYENNPVYVRFVFSDKYYDIDIETSKSLGIPISHIIASESQYNKRGILVTDMEISNKLFAEDISSDKEICNKLISKLYS